MILIEENGLRKLIPAKGMVLSNGEAHKDGEIYLGCNDKPENWYEITQADYEEILKE